jgi:hypothetical protein
VELFAQTARICLLLPCQAKKKMQALLSSIRQIDSAGGWNALMGLPPDFGRLRWLAELQPDYGIDSRSIG